MSGNDRSTFAKVFIAMMLFSLFVWMWTVALIFAWPWDKKPEWKADVRLPAVCANGAMCSVNYTDLAEAFAQKKISSLLPKEPTGEIADPDAYLRWETATGKAWQYEASLSSWHFMTTVRYKLNGETPELVGYRHYDGEVFFYALPAALFMLIGIYLRKLRG